MSQENTEWVESRGEHVHFLGLTCSSDFPEEGVWQGGELTQQPHPVGCSSADLLLRTREELKMEQKLLPSKEEERFNLDG